MKNCLKKSIACMMVSGLIMGVAAPAFAEESNMEGVSSAPVVVSEEQTENQIESRGIQLSKWISDYQVWYINLSPGFYPPETHYLVTTIDGIEYKGTLNLVNWAHTDMSGTAYYSGNVFAII